MIYKGIEYNSAYLNKPYTIHDIPDSIAMDIENTDSLPRMPGEPLLSYRKRIVQYLNDLRSRVSSFAASMTHNVEKMELQATRYNPNPGTGFFAPKSASGNYLQSQVKGIRYGGPREFTTLDIETDDNGRPITVSALKQVFNRDTGKFETVDTFQRFYHAKNSDLNYTSAVHGLTSAKLKRLRAQQYKAGGFFSPSSFYNKHYNKDEANDLKKFLGSSIIVGHNIVDYDLPHLFNTPLGNQTIDTMTVARNAWYGENNDLDSVFQRLFHKTMEQAGLPHHNSMSDVIANAMIAQEMVRLGGKTGDAYRYVMTHANTHIVPFDEYVNSMVMKGTYSDYKKGVGGYINMDETMALGDILTDKEKLKALGGKVNKETGKIEVPGFHVETIKTAEKEEYPTEGKEGKVTFESTLMSVIQNLHTEVQKAGMISQEAADAYALGNRTRMAAMVDRMARLDSEEAMHEELADLGYGEGNIDAITRAALRRKAHGQKDKIDVQISKWNRDGWLSAKQINTLARSGDPLALEEAYYGMKFEHDRDRKIERAVRHGQITRRQGDNLRDNVKSYEELEDTMDQMIQWNKKLDSSMEGVTQRSKALHGVLASLANIPAYNFERWESTFRSEVHGIKGAVRGLVPNIVYNPLSRLTDAGMNALGERTAPWKAAYRLGGIAGGTLLHAGLASGNPWVAAAGAAFKIGTQIVGNVGEAKITRWGEGIQNNFNTLGFLQDMILMPFRLLRAAIDKVIKGLGILAGALAGLTKLMTSGLTNMMSMGNPITGLTGLDYGAYAGSLSADAASLLGKGTINNMFNDFATQRMQLYTTGQLNTNRLIGASMLGVFDQVYGNNMDEESSFNSMVDALIKRTSKETPLQRKQTYMMANMINPNLAAILQSANTLGVTSYDALKHPKTMWGYGEGDLNRRRAGWQGAQWEYQFAGMQKGYTMNRIATQLWNGPKGWGISGRGLYNGFNKVLGSVADALETGKWEKVGDTIKKLWNDFLTGAENAWGAIKKIFNIEGDASPWQMLVSSFAKVGVKAIDIFKDTILPAINNVWDNIVKIVIDKMSGLMEFLSTIRVDKDEFINQVILGKKSDKPWIRSIMDTSIDDVFEKRNHYAWGTGHDSLDKFITAVKVYAEQTGDVPPIAALQLGQPWAPTKDELETAVNYLNLSPSRRNIFNKILTEQSDESLALSGAMSTAEYLDLITQHDENAGAAAYLHGRWNDTLKKRSDFFRYGNKINGEYIKQRSIVEDMVLNETRSTLEHLTNTQNVPPLIKFEFTEDKKKGAEGTVFADGSVTVRDYNGNVGVSARDGVFTMQLGASTGIVGAGY